MTEILALSYGMIQLMKTLDFDTTIILTVMFCSLLVLLFNVIAIWKLTAPVRKLAESFDSLASKLETGEKRFNNIEVELHGMRLWKEEVSRILKKLQGGQNV